jgi:hypothetical protein
MLVEIVIYPIHEARVLLVAGFDIDCSSEKPRNFLPRPAKVALSALLAIFPTVVIIL